MKQVMQPQVMKKPEYPERTTDHGQATGKFYHLRLHDLFHQVRSISKYWKTRIKKRNSNQPTDHQQSLLTSYCSVRAAAC
jgi:hypothetical protein